jgi:hypothetical protein
LSQLLGMAHHLLLGWRIGQQLARSRPATLPRVMERIEFTY